LCQASQRMVTRQSQPGWVDLARLARATNKVSFS
jgi:hypothetical protein